MQHHSLMLVSFNSIQILILRKKTSVLLRADRSTLVTGEASSGWQGNWSFMRVGSLSSSPKFDVPYGQHSTVLGQVLSS
jgi:hypothetical protein